MVPNIVKKQKLVPLCRIIIIMMMMLMMMMMIKLLDIIVIIIILHKRIIGQTYDVMWNPKWLHTEHFKRENRQ